MNTATAIRTDGPGAYLVPSASEEAVMHRVTLAPEHCDCKGFQYRGRCRHITAVVEWYEAQPLDLEEPAEDEDELEDEPIAEEVLMGELMCQVYSEGASRSVTSTTAGQEMVAAGGQATALQSRARRSAMSTLLRMPTLSPIDDAQRMREARTVVLQRVVARNMEHIFEAFLEGLKAVCNDPTHPLAQMLDDLESGPMEDRFDLDGWLTYASTRDKVQLGEAVMRAAGEAQLAVVEKLLEQAL